MRRAPQTVEADLAGQREDRAGPDPDIGEGAAVEPRKSRRSPCASAPSAGPLPARSAKDEG
jgi:hypothetical protein